MDFNIFIFAVLLSCYFLIPSFSVAFHSFFPHPLTHHFAEGAGDCPYATVIILKPFFVACCSKLSPWSCHREEPATINNHLFPARTHFSPPISLSSCCFSCFSSSAPSPSFSVFLSISPFYFHVQQLPAVKAYATSSSTHMHTHCTQFSKHTQSHTQAYWRRKR